MKILINTSNLNKGGAIQVAHSFINGLRTNSNHTFHIVLSDVLSKQIQIKDFPTNFIFHYYTIKPSLFKAVTGWDKFLSDLEKKVNPKKVFSVFAPAYWNPRSKHIAGFAKPQYIYKASPFFKQLSCLALLMLKMREILHIYYFDKFCDEIITESSDVSLRLKKLLPAKNIYTVTNYFHQIFEDTSAWDKSKLLPSFDGITLLTISANYPHKNLKIIPEVIAYLNKNNPNLKFRFVLTIKPEELIIKDNLIKNQIVFLGPVKIFQVPFLYQQADFMFLPTLLECFSASYPEAMRMGVPILTSDLTFAHGLCDNSACYFDPISPINIAEKIVDLANNKNARKILIENGKQQLKKFDTADERSEKYLRIIENS